MKARALAALALVAVAACSDDPVASDGAAAFLPCLFGRGATLEVGEVIRFEGDAGEIVCLDAGSGGAEFTLVPFFASEDGEARLDIAAVGGNVVPVTEPQVAASRAPSGVPGFRRTAEAVAAGDAVHLGILERGRREVEARRRGGAAGPRAGLAPATEAAARVVPTVGEILQLNVPVFDQVASPCDIRNVRPGRVAAVSRRAVVVNDVANPAGGFTDAEYQAFAESFDDVVFPVDSANFGIPTDIDNNGGRVIIYFTEEVNDLTPPGSDSFVGGFFFAGDLIPPQGTQRFQGCPTSNVAEIFYLLVPDPARGGPFTKENVARTAIGTIAHEMEHLISASRRIYILDAPLEDTWLDEGLAHCAEELVFYEVSGLGPRQDLGLAPLAARPEVSNTFILDNLLRYLLYVESPDNNSLLGPDNLPTRGAAWAFLRYTTDRDPGPDQEFFFDLVNSTRTGVDNVSAVIGTNSIDWMQDWTLSVYTDDAVPQVAPQYMQPSWNFRSILPIFTQGGVFPLEVIGLTSGPTAVDLRGGGAAFFRFGIASGERVALRRSTPGRSVPREFRVSIVRTR